jgi:hypothetical protein
MIKLVMAFSGAVMAAFVTGSIFATQFILANVSAMGMEVTPGVRLQATFHDLVGLSGTYLPMIAVALLIALSAATRLAKLFPGQRLVLFVLAGSLGLISIHVIIKAVLGLSGIAATRTLAGLLSQGLAGALGGYVYFAVRRAFIEPLQRKTVPPV